jgi:O-antigen ligase/polysaccharide polymerase Wzy-like membrane protein
MAIIFFVLTVLSAPFLPAGATVPRWAFLSLVAAALFFKVKPTWPMLTVIAYLALMTWLAPIRYDAVMLFWHALLFAVLFAYAQDLMDLRGIAIGLGLGMWVNSTVVIAQYFGWQKYPEMTALSGLFFNWTFYGEVAAIAMAFAACYRMWWLLPGILPSLLTGSRTAILSLGIVGLVALWPKDRLRQTPFLALLVPLTAAIFVFSHAGQTGFWDTLQLRLGVWRDTIAGLTLFGHGLGSFQPEFPVLQHHSQPLLIRFENTHNDILQVIYELGIGGAVLVGLLFWRMAAVHRTPEWYALAVFLVEGCFSFPLYEPVTGAAAACCAGYLFSCRADVRALLGSSRHPVQAGYGDRRSQSFRGIGPVVSPDAVAPVGSGLCSHYGGRHVPNTGNPASPAV